MSFITTSAITSEQPPVVESMSTTTASISSETSTTVGTRIVSIRNEDNVIETVVIPANEMICWTTCDTSTTSTTNETTTTTTTTVVTTTESNVDNYISDSDYILLCNCVAHEAGSLSIPASEKAKVVEVIMNRVESGSFPDSIYDVVTQQGQFAGASGYANLGAYSSQVNDSVKAGVDEYFANQSSYQHGYLYFHGDGRQNYFR